MISEVDKGGGGGGEDEDFPEITSIPKYTKKSGTTDEIKN